MKLFNLSVTAAMVWASALLLGSCSDDQGIDNRDKNYGYVQFKLYKQASYEPDAQAATMSSRATKPELDYLAEATKVSVMLNYQGTTISQTLTLTSAGTEEAEFGLRSQKLKLLTGQYTIATFALYDVNDELIYTGSASDEPLQILEGGLTAYDLTANVTPRGKVKFTLVKDLSGFTQTPKTRAANRQYTFDEIKTFELTVRREGDNLLRTFTGLKTKFELYFDDEDDSDNSPETSRLVCDSLLSLEAGTWVVRGYKTYDTNKILLETKSDISGSKFTVEDNRTAKPKIGITLYEANEYIQDYYALYEIWKAMDGPNWYYKGETQTRGCNWDFNKDPDLWGNQPGVELHTNGRVAKITFSDFGFGGEIPDQIGQLTEMIELYLGSHNDFNLIANDPSLALNQSLSERSRNRIDNHKKYLSIIHPTTQLTEPLAFGLAQHDIHIPETALYTSLKENQVLDPDTGHQLIIRPMDTTHGTMSNSLTKISDKIGNLKKLEYFYIANSPIAELPSTLKNLEACTDLEIYNCPNLKKFPMVITEMPALVSINIANNKQWGDLNVANNQQEIYKGLDALAQGPAREKIQILYCRQNNLKEMPESFHNFKKLGLLDMAQNKLEKLHPLTKEVSLVQFYLDYNNLTSIPGDSEGIYCGYEDIETFSVTNNKLTKVPDIFTSKTLYVMTSVDFTGNDIDGFENENNGYKGINVKTFTLANNPKITKFPLCLAKTNSRISNINLRGCTIDEIPEGSFKGKYSNLMTSIDLSYNHLSKLPDEFIAQYLPYLYGVDLSYNRFSEFPLYPGPLNSAELTVFAIRAQRDANGERCLRQWPEGLFNHKGLRGFYIGSNDLRQVTETISYLIYNLDISDNPNIVFNAKDICSAWQQGSYNLIYDKTQDIRDCDIMLK